jgi:hypothetical protein
VNRTERLIMHANVAPEWDLLASSVGPSSWSC